MQGKGTWGAYDTERDGKSRVRKEILWTSWETRADPRVRFQGHTWKTGVLGVGEGSAKVQASGWEERGKGGVDPLQTGWGVTA